MFRILYYIFSSTLKYFLQKKQQPTVRPTIKIQQYLIRDYYSCHYNNGGVKIGMMYLLCPKVLVTKGRGEQEVSHVKLVIGSRAVKGKHRRRKSE